MFKNNTFPASPEEFTQKSLELFRYQYENNTVYQRYVQYISVNPSQVDKLEKIPFLPIELFKYQKITTGNFTEQLVFESSGTTGQSPSRHYLQNPEFYQHNSHKIFENFYGRLTDYHILALLPSYLERSGSSLVYMIDYFIKQSASAHSGFYLYNHNDLVNKVAYLQKINDRKIMVWGVSFALLDLIENTLEPLEWKDVIVVETGGMKGQRKEIVREELHHLLQTGLHVNDIHSEYGMTELLSQAYSKGQGIFTEPPSMKILLRHINDPFHVSQGLRSGAINIIDLANVDSCAFIATQDLGIQLEGRGFKVMGRIDNSDMRGCNLLFN